MKKRIIASILTVMMLMTMLPATLFAEDGTATKSYDVSSTEELSTAMTAIAASKDKEAVIVLKADVAAPSIAEGTTFGVDGKHITVKSEAGEMKKLSFAGRGIMNGDCTFDNVDVTGRRIYCNGYRTIFSENGQIHLSETLYGGGYKKTVNSTHVVIAATGYINPTSYSGLHDVIGGSYQGSVEGDTYLEITGNIKMQGGNHVNPGCMKGDGSSGDGRGIPNVYVGGNATLIYDNKSDAASPAIEGTYGCEMKGNVTLDVRAGGVLGIVGTEAPVEESIIRGDLHIIAGSPDYENTNRILRLGGNWCIIGAGHLFAPMPGAVGNYAVNGNITIDTYENVWGWDKNADAIPDDVPEIYGALRGDVGGNITINTHGSHVENITGASTASTVGGDVVINATEVELKNKYYEDADYDEGDIYANYNSQITGKSVVNLNSGDVNLVRLTNGQTVNEGSQITITGTPKIRTGVVSTGNYDTSPDNVMVMLTDCKATIPFIQSSTKTQVINHSDVKLNGMWLTQNLSIEAGSVLKTDDLEAAELFGNAVVNGTWEQCYVDKTEGATPDISIGGTMTVGSKGKYIGHGSTDIGGDVTSGGMMALMKPSVFNGAYTGTNAELRLPAVQDGENYDDGTIPVKIKGQSTGTTTVNTVDSTDWQKLQKPALGDNYILSLKNADNPAQNVFLLGNEDAVTDDWFLKRMADAAGTDNYYMWQVAHGIRVVFDKNGGDTEASPNVMLQDKVEGKANHFELPTIEPTRDGYKFVGWNTKPDGQGAAFTAETDVTESMTVYAQWQKNKTYTVTYTDGVDDKEIFKDQIYDNLKQGDKTPTFNGTPERTGYTFKGWLPEVAATVTQDMVYVAQWHKNNTGGGGHHNTKYILHYETNGGTTYKDESYTAGTIVTLDKVPSREGYTFTGWYADKELKQKITTVKMTCDKTVYAGWKATGVPGILNGDDHDAYVFGYVDGTVRPKANISRSEVGAIFFRLLKEDIRNDNLTTENSFNDVVDGMWCNEAISTMAKLGIIKGRNTETFDPNASITRAEFAAICARFDTGDVTITNNFTDIAGNWAEKEIRKAATLGWIAGYSDGSFRPNNNITRAEAMTMINRVLCRMPLTPDDLLDGMIVWPDNKPKDWHYLAVQEATNSHEFERKGEVNEKWTKLTNVK